MVDGTLPGLAPLGATSLDCAEILIREVMPPDGILTLDNGMYKIWFARNYRTRVANTLLLDNALATMGAGLPSGIMAALLYPEPGGRGSIASPPISARCRLPLSIIPRYARSSASGATNTPRHRAPPTWACKCCRGSAPMRSIPWASFMANPCEGIKALYSSDRSDIIWTDADIIRIKQFCTAEVVHAIDLAAATGLRRDDLLRLSWSHVHEHEIVIPTNKSGRRVEARIPLYAELRAVLARIPKRSLTVLTNSMGRPWKTGDGLGSVFIRAKKKAGIGDLRFHDLRGTAATKFYVAGLDKRVIAEILGWTEGSVDNIIRKYVDRTAATKAVIRLLDKRVE